MAISTVSNPHFLNCGKSRTLRVVKGDAKRKVLTPNLIMVVGWIQFPSGYVSRVECQAAHMFGVPVIPLSRIGTRTLS